MAAPPSLNLLGEIGLLSSLVPWSWCLMFVLVLLSFLVLLIPFICILIVSMDLFILVFFLVLHEVRISINVDNFY